MAREHIQQRGVQNSRFEAEQMRRYQQETADATIKNSINEAGNNPYDDEAAARAEQDIIQALELKYRYSSPEKRKEALIAAKSDLAAARLAPMIQDNPVQAEACFKEHKDDFDTQTRQKFRDTIKNETEIYEIYEIQDKVDKLIEKFPQGNEQQALAYIRENFSGPLEERIAAAYKTRANEIAIDLDKNERLLKLQQDKNAEAIATNFYVNGVMPSDEQFRFMVASKQLRPEQAESIQAKADYSVVRSRIEKRILSSNPNLSRMGLDIAVMRRLGTTQQEYQAVFATAVQSALNNELADNELEYLYRLGKLTRRDIDTIKKYIKGLDDVQKNYYNAELKDLSNTNGTTLRSLIDAGLSEDVTEGIRNRFIAEANMLNPKDKNYSEELLKVKKKVLLDAMDTQDKRKDGLLWGLTDWGELYTYIQDTTLESRGIDPFPTLPAIAPAASGLLDVSAYNTASGDNPILGMVQGYVIPKGGRFTSPRGYRGGIHNGLDLSAAGGTDIVMTNYGTPLTVKSVNTAAPSKGLGNSVILTGKYQDGTTIEVSLGHMQNDSILVSQGQVLNVGNIIGKVGNTGMTSDKSQGKITNWYEGKKSGYHLDVKIKINGKYVDPETFAPPVFAPDVSK